MSIVHECSAEDCKTLTMGQFCVEHENSKVLDHARSDAVRGLVASFDTARSADAASA